MSDLPRTERNHGCPPPLRVGVIGAGWAGMAAAVRLAQSGAQVHVFEAAAQLGGRARGLEIENPALGHYAVDSGQHILIGAYTQCLALMRAVGVDVDAALLRTPLAVCDAQGMGLRLPRTGAAVWDVLRGIAQAQPWSMAERAALLTQAVRWRLRGFRCAPSATVADVCSSLPATVMRDFIAPLCESALNLPVHRASAQVFLTVLRDALLGSHGSCDLLLPRVSLGALWPEAAAQWLAQRGLQVQLRARVQALRYSHNQSADEAHARAHGWVLELGDGLSPHFDHIVLATGSTVAARLAASVPSVAAQGWARCAAALQHTAIATVYASTVCRQGDGIHTLAHPMLALRSGADAPIQFAFDRAHTHGAAQAGLIALVASACDPDMPAAQLQAQATAQARAELQLPDLHPIKTLMDKRATFACTPALTRPPAAIDAPHGLWACGDYVRSPYPATLEAAMRSGCEVADALLQARQF